MTNIYNKTVLVKNGTLIGNWLEEEVLREKTGEGRTIPGRHIPKKTLDFDKAIINENPKDDTFKRIIGEKPFRPYKTINGTYGDFSQPEAKYQKVAARDQIFDNFFQSYVNNESNANTLLEENIKNIRLYDTTTKDLHVQQLADYSSIGHRHMMTQDSIPIPADRPDKLFMASHQMSKFPNVIHDVHANDYIDKYIPYYKDKEITFWSTNLEKGNTYRSHTQGINSFARSSGFTQDIQRTKGAKQFYGNTKNSPESKNVHLNEYDIQFYENYKKVTEEKNAPIDLLPDVKCKILSLCAKKGWTGLRQLKIYLRNLSKRKSNIIDKTNWKYFLTNFAIFLTDKEIDYIYQKFDHMKKNEINFIEFLDSLRSCNEIRQSHINNFIAQVKPQKEKYISFKKLEKIIMADLHPEVLNFIKTWQDIKKEYLTTWDNLKEDDFVTKEDFVYYFTDVSTCIDSDEDFVQCLRSLGYSG